MNEENVFHSVLGWSHSHLPIPIYIFQPALRLARGWWHLKVRNCASPGLPPLAKDFNSTALRANFGKMRRGRDVACVRDADGQVVISMEVVNDFSRSIRKYV